MRPYVLLLALLGQPAHAQLYPYADQFVEGEVVLRDSTVVKGQVQWMEHQNQKLRFRKSAEAEPEKYAPEDLLGFSAEGYTFDVLQKVSVYAENAALLGKTSRLKHLFAQRLHAGTFTIHAVFIQAYDGVSGAIQSYPNLLFHRTAEPQATPVPYPFRVRMKDGRYEQAKEPLYALFKDQPAVLELLRAHRQEDSIGPLVEAVQAIDAR